MPNQQMVPTQLPEHEVPKDKQQSLQKKPMKMKPVKAIPVERIGRTRVEEEEDEYIAYLERKLGYIKPGKGKAKQMGDGLDGIPLTHSKKDCI